jgi:guanylate kinase
MITGTLYTISAPSGAGKTSLVKALLQSDKQDLLRVSVSHTTRAKRPGEFEGVNYHFVNQQQFEQMVSDEAFLEYATVFGNSYGTSKKWVSEQLHAGYDVILEIDWQGAEQTRQWVASQEGIDSTGIFIFPPSLAELRQRLTGRGQDSDEVIETRMAEAVTELAHYSGANYLVVNDDFDQALTEIKSIICANRLHTEQQADVHRQLIEDLLHGAD